FCGAASFFSITLYIHTCLCALTACAVLRGVCKAKPQNPSIPNAVLRREGEGCWGRLPGSNAVFRWRRA
ncbi:MAG: hypothetical protein OWQ51_06785, partial [Pyrobaculum arsenaticum]|uniref:hypothetical protein n=2 Tax=Pyrobaculum TaxID=2276 RepID=UPI00227275AB|nr:hypothetical protein [Pyrobaculum arsenaticum]